MAVDFKMLALIMTKFWFRKNVKSEKKCQSSINRVEDRNAEKELKMACAEKATDKTLNFPTMEITS